MVALLINASQLCKLYSYSYKYVYLCVCVCVEGGGMQACGNDIHEEQ